MTLAAEPVVFVRVGVHDAPSMQPYRRAQLHIVAWEVIPSQPTKVQCFFSDRESTSAGASVCVLSKSLGCCISSGALSTYVDSAIESALDSVEAMVGGSCFLWTPVGCADQTVSVIFAYAIRDDKNTLLKALTDYEQIHSYGNSKADV
jgi:hypothetical protein